MVTRSTEKPGLLKTLNACCPDVPLQRGLQLLAVAVGSYIQ